MPKPALKVALEKAELESGVRNKLEAGLEQQLKSAGIEYGYETLKVPFTVPAREAKYVSDFSFRFSNIIIEGKGHFGGSGRDIAKNSAERRKKYLLVKEQHPELDIRFVFHRAKTPIYPRSPTTHGQWATDHGFKWSDKGVIPPAWIIEIQHQQKKRQQ
jgi:hypothetical protein